MPLLVRTVIIDDSAFVRKVVQEMLSGSPFIDVVGAARDGEEGLALVKDLKPDVVTCDLTMPRMGGVEFVRRQMAARPVPILMLTASPEDCAEVMAAIDAGAVDLVQKPTALANDALRRVREELVEKVKEAARKPLTVLPAALPRKPVAVPLTRTAGVELVVIGISTGGPQALRRLLAQFPRDFPVPVAIVLHMPVGYTALFAEKLNEISEMEVVEAQGGEILKPGAVVLAKAGWHLKLKRTAAGVVTELAKEPSAKPHCPSVDVLFRSAAEVFGSALLAVVMTGMGDDGREGAAWVKAQGGIVLTESEESCIVFGMPRAVAESGLSDGTYPLHTMAEGITNHL